jgi:hypothetical protein
MNLYSVNFGIINEQVDPSSGIGSWISGFANQFLQANKSLYELIYQNEYFGKSEESKGLYGVYNALNHFLLSMVFLREDIDLAVNNDEEYDIEELKEKYNISCILKYIECHSDLNGWELYNIVEEAYDNFELGISEMAIGETFIIR